MARRKASGVVIHNVEQRSEEWHALRKKYPLTASHAQAIAANGKGLETLVLERLTRRYSSGVDEEYTNEHIERGIELEEQARSLYELETGRTAEKVGFVTNESISSVAGASPDSLVDSDGLLEIKCPSDTKFFRMMVQGIAVEPQYGWQCQMQMLITGRAWADLCLYNPNFERSFLIQRCFADKEMQDALVDGLKKGEALIREIEAKLTK